jgi:hypothetical protein
MSEVGDAIELTYSTAPGATVTLTWINRDTEEVLWSEIPVAEQLDDDGNGTGQYPVVVTGPTPGFWEARFKSTGTANTVESYFERFEITNQPPPLATLAEYEELYGSLSTPRQALARGLLRRASKLLRDSYPSLSTKIAESKASRDTIGLVAINMTAKVLRNLAGLRSETTGPFSRSYDMEAASGLLRIGDDDRILLADAGLGDSAGSKRGGKIGTARVKANMAPPSARPGRRWPRGGTFPSGW